MSHSKTVHLSLKLVPSSRKVTGDEQVILKGKEVGFGALEGRLVSGTLWLS